MVHIHFIYRSFHVLILHPFFVSLFCWHFIFWSFHVLLVQLVLTFHLLVIYWSFHVLILNIFVVSYFTTHPLFVSGVCQRPGHWKKENGQCALPDPSQISGHGSEAQPARRTGVLRQCDHILQRYCGLHQHQCAQYTSWNHTSTEFIVQVRGSLIVQVTHEIIHLLNSLCR